MQIKFTVYGGLNFNHHFLLISLLKIHQTLVVKCLPSKKFWLPTKTNTDQNQIVVQISIPSMYITLKCEKWWIVQSSENVEGSIFSFSFWIKILFSFSTIQIKIRRKLSLALYDAAAYKVQYKIDEHLVSKNV